MKHHCLFVDLFIGFFLAVGVLLACIALSAVIDLAGPKIKRKMVDRMNADWMERGSSPWHIRLLWRVLRPFVSGR